MPHALKEHTPMTLVELFSTFHDFDIVRLENQDNGLLMTLKIPWGELWDKFDFCINVELIGGQIIVCKYFVYTGEIDTNSGQPKCIDKVTNDIKTIEKLGIDIQRFRTTNNNEYNFYCNGYDQVGGAEITLKADNYVLYDIEGRPISADRYKSWYKDWWAQIKGSG